MSNTLQKRISKFASYDIMNKAYRLSAPLIAQIGKNYSSNFNSLISGDELLKIACDKISEAQKILGGKIVYLECEDCDKLTNFYNVNGFVVFGKRALDRDEELLKGKYLLQLLKYIR